MLSLSVRRIARSVKRRYFRLATLLSVRFIYWMDRLFLLGVNSDKNEGGVLIVRLDAIGDFILWLDYARDYRVLFPRTKLTLAANAAWSDVARRMAIWDEVISVNLVSFVRFGTYRFKLLRAIRRRGFRVAIQPTYSRFLLAGDALICASQAYDRIGMQADLTNMPAAEKPLSDRCYTRLLASTRRALGELDRNAEFIRLLSGGARAATVAAIPLLGHLRGELAIPRDYFVVFPGASLPLRQWPVARFSEIARLISEKSDWHIVLCGGPGERSLCNYLESSIDRPCANLAGRTELWELVEVIRGAAFLIGNETSAIHIAAAVGTPSVCLLGGGHYGRFVPYQVADTVRRAPIAAVHKMACFNCNWHCSFPYTDGDPVPCIENISVSDAMAAVDLALSR